MPIFNYTVSDSGERRSGTIEAASLDEAGELLRRRSLLILQLSSVSAASVSKQETSVAQNKHTPSMEFILAEILTPGRRIEIALDQLAALLDAGVLIVSAVDGVAQQSPFFLKRAFFRAGNHIRNGMSFIEALRAETPWFSEIALGLISVGEANGDLCKMLHQSSQWLARSRRICNRLIEALMYPTVVTLLAFGVGFFLTTRVLPKILDFIVKNTGSAALPPATQLLIDITNIFRAYGIYGILAIAASLLSILLARRNNQLGYAIDFVVLRLPLIGPALVASANAIWCRTLGLLLESGIPVIRALDLIIQNTINRHIREQFIKIKNEILLGVSISAAMKKTSLVTLCPMATMMLEVGEGVGTADASLLKAAEYSEEDLLQRIELMSKLIEPAIYIVVGTMVGFVYYAFFMATQAVTQSVMH